jgi:hypothetical protein
MVRPAIAIGPLMMSVIACNAVFDIEEATDVSYDSDLSDGQEERPAGDLVFEAREAGADKEEARR